MFCASISFKIIPNAIFKQYMEKKVSKDSFEYSTYVPKFSGNQSFLYKTFRTIEEIDEKP